MLCEGDSDDCTGEATTTRDTSDGYLNPASFCAACATAYDRWLENYEPPEPDGEAFRGREASAYDLENEIHARRMK